MATPDLVDLALPAQAGVSLLDLEVDFQQALVVDYQLDLEAGYQLAQVADCLPARAEASLLDLAVGFQQAQVVDYQLDLAVDYQLAQVVDYQQVLATIGAVCLVLIMAGKNGKTSKIHRKSLSTSKGNEKNGQSYFF